MPNSVTAQYTGTFFESDRRSRGQVYDGAVQPGLDRQGSSDPA
jgi:hypothetical protein